MDDKASERIKKLKKTIKKQKSEIFVLKDIIENLPGSIYWKDKDGVYLNINKTSSESMASFGFAHGKHNIVGKTDYQLFPKKMAEEFRSHDRKVMESKKESSREETAQLPSGSTAVQLSTKRPLFDEKGKGHRCDWQYGGYYLFKRNRKPAQGL